MRSKADETLVIVETLIFVPCKFDDYSRISPFCDAIVNRVDPIYTS